MTLSEEKEFQVMRANISFNPATGRFISKHPWKENRKFLVYNESMAFAVMKSTEKQLKRKGEHHVLSYNSQIRDMLDRKAARRVAEEEVRNYQGQKYFITHWSVEKPDSKITPLRIVFNSSARF